MAKKFLVLKAGKVEIIADTKQIAADFIASRLRDLGTTFLTDLTVYKGDLLDTVAADPTVTITDSTP